MGGSICIFPTRRLLLIWMSMRHVYFRFSWGWSRFRHTSGTGNSAVSSFSYSSLRVPLTSLSNWTVRLIHAIVERSSYLHRGTNIRQKRCHKWGINLAIAFWIYFGHCFRFQEYPMFHSSSYNRCKYLYRRIHFSVFFYYVSIDVGHFFLVRSPMRVVHIISL